MATVFNSPFLTQRLHRLRQRDLDYDEDQRFGRCDCTSYSYFALSMVLFSVGSVITVLALGDADGYIFSNLGHMWLVGPIFMCSGLMVAVKSMLYLRRKSVIQMLLHQRAIFRVYYYGCFPITHCSTLKKKNIFSTLLHLMLLHNVCNVTLSLVNGKHPINKSK